jgi:hypothetical protein
LEIEKGSDDWYEYFDLAAAHAGKILAHPMEDDELVKKLPLVFRTLRGQKVSKEKLDKLAEVIRKSRRGGQISRLKSLLHKYLPYFALSKGAKIFALQGGPQSFLDSV